MIGVFVGLMGRPRRYQARRRRLMRSDWRSFDSSGRLLGLSRFCPRRLGLAGSRGASSLCGWGAELFPARVGGVDRLAVYLSSSVFLIACDRPFWMILEPAILNLPHQKFHLSDSTARQVLGGPTVFFLAQRKTNRRPAGLASYATTSLTRDLLFLNRSSRRSLGRVSPLFWILVYELAFW